jgi:hypothetical protein
LGFTYQEDELYAGNAYSNSYGGSKGGNGRKGVRGGKYRPTKDYSVLSAFKFIVKNGNDYRLNMYDPNENVDWKDVV